MQVVLAHYAMIHVVVISYIAVTNVFMGIHKIKDASSRHPWYHFVTIQFSKYIRVYPKLHITFQVQYAQELLCFSTDQACQCLVRTMEQLTLPTGEPILNSFECTLLCLSDSAETVPSTTIKRAVSIVHQCGSTCTFQNTLCSKSIEREPIDTCRLTFVHD